jgi:hypothetical protein
MGSFAEEGRRFDLVIAGLSLGFGACFKHDVAGYAALACAAAALRKGPGNPVGRVATLLVPAALPVAALVAWLWREGAAEDAWRSLVEFPATHFRHVRPESFPILPPLPDTWPGWRADRVYRVARDLVYWAMLHLPTLALLCGLAGALGRRSRLSRAAKSILVIAGAAYPIPMFWLAAHVQVNTHKVTLAALALLVVGIGFGDRRRLIALLSVGWSLVLVAEPLEVMRLRLRDGVETLELPRLSGIRVTRGDAAWMRGLHAALSDAAPPRARLLLAGARNDVLIFADSTPFWLSIRIPATCHHELHPGITDTEVVQRRMISDLESGAPPVVVREHRFRDASLDRWGRIFQSHGVPVGSDLLDEWLARRYEPGPRFGRYEVMRARR